MKKVGLGVLFLAGVLLLLLGVAAYALLHRVEGEYFDADGVRIHYTVEGQGEPVVLIHGYGAHADLNWRLTGVTRGLRKHFRVIAMDVRGHGLSDKPHAPRYGLETIHDVRRLLDHLGIDKAHIVGYSMGGFITLKFVSLYPERVLSAMPCGMAWMEPGSELTKLGQQIHAGQVGTWEAWRLDLDALKYMVDAFYELAMTEEELRKIDVPMCMARAVHEELVVGGRPFEDTIPGLQEVALPRGGHSTIFFYSDFYRCVEEFLLAQQGKPTEAEAR